MVGSGRGEVTGVGRAWRCSKGLAVGHGKIRCSVGWLCRWRRVLVVGGGG